jgi:hypothetical protein
MVQHGEAMSKCTIRCERLFWRVVQRLYPVTRLVFLAIERVLTRVS